MPELNLPAPNLVIGRDHYAGRAKAWTSIRSAQVGATTTATLLRTLLTGVENAYTDEAVDLDQNPNGVIQTFSGTIVLIDYTKVKGSSVTITATVSSGGVDITDNGAGVLSGANVTGTIDYTTGEWTVTWSTGAPDDESVMVVDYTESYNFAVNDIMGLWLYPESDIRATFDGVTPPTADFGQLISESIFLTGQPGLIGNMIVYGDAVNISLEIMV